MAALALGACGDDEVQVEVPRDVPDLTVPTTAEPPSGEEAPATEEEAAPAPEEGTAAPEGTEEAVPEGTEEVAPEGAAAPEGEDTPASGGEYDAFCAQNPGACPTE